MNELVPCPECQRHVRKTEASCPFCGQALSLSHLPPRVLPTRRLGRAATFAFGAGVVGATALVSCSDGSDGLGGNMAVYGAPAGGTFSMNAGSGGKTDGGSGGKTDGGSGGKIDGGSGGSLSQGGSAQPIYGAPAAGTGNEPMGGAAGAGGAGGAGGAPGDDNVGGVYGAPTSDGGGGAGGAP